MTKLKNTVFKIAVALLILLLLATVVSKTIHNLMLPQVTAVFAQRGELRDKATYRLRCAVGDELTSDTSADGGFMYVSEMRLTYDELYALKRSSSRAEVRTFEGVVAATVSLTVAQYEYDAQDDMFLTSLAIGSASPLERGLPVAVTLESELTVSGGQTLVPLEAVYNDGASYYVYAISEAKTMWGVTQIVTRRDVAYFGGNYEFISCDYDVSRGGKLACYPTQPLHDGASVRIVP
jgi:hypothetical protein